MKKHANNYAFIDAQNLYIEVQRMGWRLDYRRFRVYLRDKYHVTTAYRFIGYVAGNQSLYRSLERQGYHLIYKPVVQRPGQTPKGNVDAELVLHAMIQYPNYDRAVLVTSDGDFACLAEYLYQQGKLETVLSPQRQTCSVLLRKAARERINFFDNLRGKLAYKNRKGTA